MKPLFRIFLTTLTLSASLAQAQNFPEFAQYNTPDVIPCQMHNGFYLCTDASRPDEHVVRYQNNATGEITMQKEKTYEVVRCREKGCKDTSGNYRGEVKFIQPHPAGQSMSGQTIIFKDFYVYPGNDGKDYAYRTGTGPLFGGTVASTTTQSTSSNTIFDIWCNPQGDYCDYQNQQLTRAQLPQFIPVAKDTSDCMLEFCYNAKTEVIGLNPDYTF